MTYEELVSSIQKTYAKADAKNVAEHVAIQVNVTGEGEGAFYIEVADGAVHVEPYEYYDRDAIISTSAQNILDVVSKKGTVEALMEQGLANVYGDVEKTRLLGEIKLKPGRKPGVKKAEPQEKDSAPEKKPAAKKTATKASEVKAATGKTKRATKTAKKG
jgi:hypothetical protein